MCEKCVEIDETISRYRRLQYTVSDKQMQEAAERLVEELEAKKAAIHPNQ
jgi:hypothetical protein